MGILHPRTFMGIFGRNTLIKIYGLGSSFKHEEYNSIMLKEPQYHVLASADAAYEDPEQHATMRLMSSGEEFHDENASHLAYQKQTSFTRSTYSENTNWETASMCMSLEKESIRKATGRVNTPMECWGRNKPPHISFRKVPHVQELNQQDRPGRGGACKAFNTRV